MCMACVWHVYWAFQAVSGATFALITAVQIVWLVWLGCMLRALTTVGGAFAGVDMMPSAAAGANGAAA